VAIPVKGLSLSWGLDMLWRRVDVNPHVSAVVTALRNAK
jgi:hypothetical protein